jgi:hypothetical protein
MIKDDDEDRAVSRQIVVVLGWADELRRIPRRREQLLVVTYLRINAVGAREVAQKHHIRTGVSVGHGNGGLIVASPTSRFLRVR